jgi:hypothetical protein
MSRSETMLHRYKENGGRIEPYTIVIMVTAVDLAAKSSGLRGRRRTYRTILKLADHVLCKMVRHVLLRPLRPELLAAKSRQR